MSNQAAFSAPPAEGANSPPIARSQNLPGLLVVRELFQQFNSAGLSYCHWKSNDHLDAAISGLTDLDVLVDPRRHRELQGILAATGFRRFQATALTAYPAVEDYLALDELSGRMVHLHLHYRLTLGQMHLKGYRLPWEAEVLATRRYDTERGIYVTAPEMELLLLLVRFSLKKRWRTTIAAKLGLGGSKSGFANDFAYLVERADVETVALLAGQLVAPEAEERIRRIVQGCARAEDRGEFVRIVKTALGQYRTYSTLSAWLFAGLREAVWVAGGLSRRRFHWAVPLRRYSPRGGAVVAFLGSDGAGKSSICAEMVTWLSQKLDVVPIYFGSGDGPASLLRMPMQLPRRLLERRGSSASAGGNRIGWRGRLRAIALVPWALSLSLEKRAKHRKMIRARNKGMVVICDRYPQVDHPGFNDGCLLGNLTHSRRRYARALAAWEIGSYASAQVQPPDLVIKLIASPDVALSRRPEMSLDEISRRVDAVRSLRFSPETRVIEVDADRPFEEVARTVKSLVWELL